jgi:hypothetical protein
MKKSTVLSAMLLFFWDSHHVKKTNVRSATMSLVLRKSILENIAETI